MVYFYSSFHWSLAAVSPPRHPIPSEHVLCSSSGTLTAKSRRHLAVVIVHGLSAAVPFDVTCPLTILSSYFHTAIAPVSFFRGYSSVMKHNLSSPWGGQSLWLAVYLSRLMYLPLRATQILPLSTCAGHGKTRKPGRRFQPQLSALRMLTHYHGGLGQSTTAFWADEFAVSPATCLSWATRQEDLTNIVEDASDITRLAPTPLPSRTWMPRPHSWITSSTFITMTGNQLLSHTRCFLPVKSDLFVNTDHSGLYHSYWITVRFSSVSKHTVLSPLCEVLPWEPHVICSALLGQTRGWGLLWPRARV